MNRSILLVLFSIFFVIPGVWAQDVTQTAWLASFNTFKLNAKWSIHLDVQWRSTDDVEQLQTFLFRPGINYHIKQNQIITAGYAFIPNRYVSMEDNALLAEHRIWQQFIVNQPIGVSAIQHRFRLEERFVPIPVTKDGELMTDDYAFSSRVRYFVRTVLPFAKTGKAFEKGWFGALQNELFLNITNQQNVNGETFDQNRLYGAIGYRVAKGFDLEAGYMWQFVNRREGLQNINNNIGQLAFYWRR